MFIQRSQMMLVKFPDRWCLTKKDTRCWYTLDTGGVTQQMNRGLTPRQSLRTPISTDTYLWYRRFRPGWRWHFYTFWRFWGWWGAVSWRGRVFRCSPSLPPFWSLPPQVTQNISNELGIIRNDIHSHIWPAENFPFVYQYHPQNFKVFVIEDELAVITNTQYSNELPAFSSQRVCSREWLQGFPLELSDKFIIS